MTVFNVIEKRQKSPFLPSGLLQKSSLLNQKSSFTIKFSPCSSLEVTFLFLFVSRAEAFYTVHPGLASIFNITTALHAEKKPEFLTAFVPPLIFFFIFMQLLRPSTEVLRLLWFSLVANSKIWSVWARNSLVVESQSYFVSERPFFQFHEEEAKFANKEETVDS